MNRFDDYFINGVGLPPEGDEQWLISFQLTGRCDPNTASLILPEESVLYV